MALMGKMLFTAHTVCDKCLDNGLEGNGGFTMPIHFAIHKDFKLKLIYFSRPSPGDSVS